MTISDFDLIQRVLGGDENAFTLLVNRYQKQVHTLVWRKIGDFHIAQEITQDVFLKAYKKLPTLKPPYNFPGWLYVIATRRCIAWKRKKQLPTTSLDVMPTIQLEELSYDHYQGERTEAADIEHQRDLVKVLLEKLPESERTVVTLHYLAEMPCEEISEFLGVSPNTIKSRLHRARERLKKQEHLLQDTSGIFQVPPTLMENIIREVARVKPISPIVSKPWVPWVFSFTSTLLLIFVMGFGTRALFRFQQPYSLDATSEMTIELVEAPVVLPLKLKFDARTQLGNADTSGRNSGAGQQPGPNLLSPLHPKNTDAPTQSGWIQTKGPGGISAPGLFLASDKSFYTVMKSGLYRLTAQADAWELISSSGPNREFSRAMVEREDTFYLLASNELLASRDNGKTWAALGSRPEGDPVALIITERTQERSPQSADMAMYLILKTEIYRSEDTGKKWESIGDVLRPDPETDNPDFRIWDARAVDNTLFVGTSQGLFQFADGWEKAPVPTPHDINSLAVAESRFYVGTRVNLQYGLTSQVFYSTDLGDSWTDITPTHEHSTKMISPIRVVSVGKTLMLIGFKGVLLSYDRGKTWMDPGDDAFGAFPTVALDENNFYRANYAEIIRSTDGGFTWHPFMTGLVSSNVRELIAVKNDLYAVTTGSNIVKSKDSGESWESINMVDGYELVVTRVEATDTTLYVSSSGRNAPQLFHLSVDDDALIPVQGVPDFKEDDLTTEWRKRLQKARETGVKVRETEQLWRKSILLNAKEDATNGGFVLAGETVFMEHRRQLFRWRPGETAWYYTGLEDHGEPLPIGGKGFTLGASGNVVYAGKRDKHLFQSLDNGNTWSNITESLAFPFAYFKEIIFLGSTVYISTDAGVMNSRDGETWCPLTGTDGCTLVMDAIATDDSIVYGVSQTGVYRLNNDIEGIWIQVASEIPGPMTSLIVVGDTLYVGTDSRGVLRLSLSNL